MSQRPARPANFPWLTPYLVVKDADAALAFYQRAFGFEKRMTIPGPDGKIKHGEASYRDAVIMFSPESNTPECNAKAPATSGVAPAVGLYLYCDDVDALYTRAVAAGAKSVSPPENMFWGDRMCNLLDPDGHSWSFATNVADFDPSKVPH